MKLPYMKCLYLLSIFLSGSCFSQQVLFENSTIPKIFASGLVSDGFDNRDFALSPRGDEFFYTLQSARLGYSAILHCKKENSGWSLPEVAWFSGRFNDLEPSFSPDGSRLYFSSDRPLSIQQNGRKDFNLWYLQKKDGKWMEPVDAGEKVNTERNEFYPSPAANGNLYFTRESDSTRDDIYVAINENGVYKTTQMLPAEVNSAGFDFNAYVDPEEQFIIFSSYKRPDDMGGGDLYVSIRKNGLWQPAKNLGTTINSKVLDYSPFVTSDKKYFFFTSKRSLFNFPPQKPLKYNELIKMLTSAGNLSDDIYYMDFNEVKKLF